MRGLCLVMSLTRQRKPLLACTPMIIYIFYKERKWERWGRTAPSFGHLCCYNRDLLHAISCYTRRLFTLNFTTRHPCKVHVPRAMYNITKHCIISHWLHLWVYGDFKNKYPLLPYVILGATFGCLTMAELFTLKLQSAFKIQFLSRVSLQYWEFAIHAHNSNIFRPNYLCIIIIITTLNYCYIALTIYLVNLFLLTHMLPQHQINITK